MKVIRTEIPEVLILEPAVFRDARGAVFESYNRREFHKATGVDAEFVQDNHSVSTKSVLRGIHYQVHRPQGKLIRILRGEVYDVAVDLRRSSPTFRRWVGVSLTDHRALWIPAGFGHGLLARSDTADVLYKLTDFYAPEHERCVRWDDPEIGVRWPLEGAPILSAKDQAGKRLAEAELFA
jgi:dTDP-4-dehydrorhamnose 3,5-epimerase